MQPVTVHCRAPEGLDTPEVNVEVYLGPGLPGLSIVGLVETAVKESRDRVRAAIRNSGFDMPDQRIVVSLAPADVPKNGSRYDLPIAIGILCASKQLPRGPLTQCEFLGELSLNGELRAIPGALPSAMAALNAKRKIVIPAGCGPEAGLLNDPGVLTAACLLEVAKFLGGSESLPQAPGQTIFTPPDLPDLCEVDGQPKAKRALEIAATGRHHLLMTGPPGTGKSMLARRLPGLLPPPSKTEMLETAALYSLRGQPAPAWHARPFRAPHHSATAPALAGGCSNPRPGEASLAHNGVLFLDELPEFNRQALEMLREPLETGCISVARARRTLTFPARFQLVAAMNPCPCGYHGDTRHECHCSPQQIHRYQGRISGPFMDRLDICVQLGRERLVFSADTPVPENSAQVRERIMAAIQCGIERCGQANATLDSSQLQRWCMPDIQGRRLLEEAAEKLALSRRACDRTLRVARSIADLAGLEAVTHTHVAEALSLRL